MMIEPTRTVLETGKETCIECYTVCIDTLKYCKNQQGKYLDITMMSMMRDCAEMCMMCINMINDGSEFMGNACNLCAELCNRTAMVCEQMNEDPKMMFCASICRKCAENCKTMALNSASYFRRATLISEDAFLHS